MVPQNAADEASSHDEDRWVCAKAQKGPDDVNGEPLRLMNERKPRKPPVRTTVPIPTNIKPAMVERAKVDADRGGYKSLRAYLEALIDQGVVDGRDAEDEPEEPDAQTKSLAAAYPSSAWALGPAILANRTVVALEALADRIGAGEDVQALRVDLMSLRWEIGQHLLSLRADYDREVEARDRRHYARFGTVDE